MIMVTIYRGAIRNAPYKKHFGKMGDFDGVPYKKHFQNWQFDVSLLEKFWKKGVSFSPFFKKISKIFPKFTYRPYSIGGHDFFLDYFFC